MTRVAPGETMTGRSLKLAKISVPLVADAVDRPRLTEKIGATAEQPILWISGPAGCGKTTLASAYVRAQKPTCLWYQGGSGDADPASFFHYLRLASQAASPRSRKPLPPALAPEFAAGLPMFARRFFRDLFGRLKPPFLVVFDNVQDGPEGSPFWELLREGLEQIPPGGRVVLASRSGPPPALARFRAGRQLVEIGWTDLRFTRTESDVLVKHLAGGHVEPVIAARMFEATDGWIAIGTASNKLFRALCEAIEYLIHSGFQPTRTTHLVFGADEEVGGRAGARKAWIVSTLAGQEIQVAPNRAEPENVAHFVQDDIDQLTSNKMVCENSTRRASPLLATSRSSRPIREQ